MPQTTQTVHDHGLTATSRALKIGATGSANTYITTDGTGAAAAAPAKEKAQTPADEQPEGDTEKMYESYHAYGGATSFADLEAAEAAEDEQHRLYKLVDQFGMLSRNILRNEMVTDKPTAIGALVTELAGRMVEGEERQKAKGEGKNEGDPPADAAPPADETNKETPGGVLGEQASGVLVWKDRHGTMRWLGTHTNHYIDRDNPPDILAAEAHQRFADRVSKGIDPAPELWIWHAPAPVGDTDYLAWDDRGFLVSSGTVFPEWEETVKAMTESGEVLGMSHGMPQESIRRDRNDPRVILDYRSREISILPLDKAANLLTTFATEEAMEKGLRNDQRQRLVGMMGEDNVKRLETELERKARLAGEKGLEAKETSPAEEEADDLDEAEAAPVPAAEVKAEKPAETETPATAEGDAPLTRNEIVEAIAAAVESVTAAFGKSINEVAVQVEALQKEVAASKKEMAAQVAEKAAATPKASVAALLSKRLNTGLGNPLAAEDPLMKGGPEEAEGEEVLYGFGGHL